MGETAASELSLSPPYRLSALSSISGGRSPLKNFVLKPKSKRKLMHVSFC